MCNPRSAWYDEDKHQIAPSRDVLFNPRLTTNDGVLANELMAKHGAMYPDAIQAVEALVQHVQNALNEGQPYRLPGLGKLYKEDDGQLRFIADAEFERMLRSFGHASIPLVARATASQIDVTSSQPTQEQVPNQAPVAQAPSAIEGATPRAGWSDHSASRQARSSGRRRGHSIDTRRRLPARRARWVIDASWKQSALECRACGRHICAVGPW